MIKRALIVGINYAGTGNELKGCINDANNMKVMLEEKGFTEIEMILEKDATTANILAGLKRLVSNVKYGDVVVFHYSGHGSQTYSTLEEDKLDEIICPIDINWIDKVITDNDLKNIFNPVPPGVNVSVILDCCHSGTALDQDETATLNINEDLARSVDKVKIVKKSINSRYMPMPESFATNIEERQLELREWSTSRDINRSALLIAGCMPHQTSADAKIGGVYQGAATYALLSALKTNPNASYQEIAERMNAFMVVNKFTQRPQLDGWSRLYGTKFLETFGVVEEPIVAQPINDANQAAASALVETASDDEGDSKTGAVLAIICVIVILAILFG